MAGLLRWLRVGALLVAGALGSLASAQVPAANNKDAAERELDRLHAWLSRELRVSPELQVDPALRLGAQAMVDPALPRMRQVLSDWLADERRLQAGATSENHVLAVTLRTYNEMALWQLDSAGPEHDLRQQQAFANSRACAVSGKAPTFLDTLVQVWQQVPGPQRAAFLASESQLLQRWGTARALVPERPSPAVDDMAWQAVDDLVNAGTAPPAPLPPLLAWRFLGEKPSFRRGAIRRTFVCCGSGL